MSSHTSGYVYSHLTINEAKQPHLLNLPWAMFPWWSFGPYAHSYLQNIWCNEDPKFCDILHKWNGKQNAWSTTSYQMWPGWLLMVGFLTSIFWTSSYVCSIPLGFAYCLIHLPRTLKHMHVVCMRLQWITFCLHFHVVH